MDCLVRKVWSLRCSPMVLLVSEKYISVFTEIYFVIYSYMFWWEICIIIFWLKNKGGWLIICTLQEKKTSCACLAGSVSKVQFSFECPFIYLLQVIIQVSTWDINIFNYREVSSAGNFLDKFSRKFWKVWVLVWYID